MAGIRKAPGSALKIVITGPFGSGKTTAIQAISEIEVVSTDTSVTDSTRALKSDTTVAMDFGRLTIDSELVLYLFGTPGQARFDFMWEILSEGMLGFVLMVDATRPETLVEGREILEAFQQMSNAPFVVGVNKVASFDAATEQAVRHALGCDDNVAILPTDARDKDRVKTLLLTLCYSVADSLTGASAAIA